VTTESQAEERDERAWPGAVSDLLEEASGVFVRFRVPGNLGLAGSNEADLNLKTSFTHGDLTCQVDFVEGTSYSYDELPEISRHARFDCKMQVVVCENAPGGCLSSLVDSKDWNKLAALLRAIANRCIRAMRHYGLVLFLQELRDDGDSSYDVFSWRTEASKDGVLWEPLIAQPGDLANFLAYLRSRHTVTSVLYASSWPQVEEAIQDNLCAPPEDELTANAIEHLLTKNYRLALLESVIGLEIVLNTYLREYMRTCKGLSRERIEDFLSPNLGLTGRLAGLLDLTIPQDELEHYNLERVRTAVRWRNKVTHETGRLPDGVSESQLHEHVMSVISLTLFLGHKARQIRVSPDEAAIAKHMQEKYPTLHCIVNLLPNHEVKAAFMASFFAPESPNLDEPAGVVRDLIRLIQERDPRFVADRHLEIKFYEFPWRLTVVWQGGTFRSTQHSQVG